MSDDWEQIDYQPDFATEDEGWDEEEDCDYGFEVCLDPACKRMGNCGFECDQMLEEIRLRMQHCPGCQARVHWYQRKFVEVDGQRWHRRCKRQFDKEFRAKEAAK